MENPIVKIIAIALAVVGVLAIFAALAMLIGCGMMGCGGMMDGMMGGR